MRRWLVLLVVAIRLLAASALLFGPWTDEAAELMGWDASRFQAIHDAPGRPWVDHEVEYPPGSVALIEVITVGGSSVGGSSVGGSGVVGTQRMLVALSLVVDLGVAGLLERHRRNAGLAYLVLGTAAVPAGLLRFDLWAAGCTAIGLVVLAGRERAGRRSRWARSMDVAGFAVAVTVGAAIKISPGLLIPVAFAVRRRAEALAALAIGAALGGGWLLWAGTDALTQVTSLRGVTGWHVESVPGSLLALLGHGPSRFEADAYRIGTLSERLVLAGRVVTMVVVVGLGLLAHRMSRTPANGESAASLAMLGSTAALILTAPLLSPQFLLWLTPAAALAWVGGHRRPTVLTGGAIALTALTLARFGPPGLDDPLAAALLLTRDALLIGVIASCAQELRSPSAGQPGWKTR